MERAGRDHALNENMILPGAGSITETGTKFYASLES